MRRVGDRIELLEGDDSRASMPVPFGNVTLQATTLQGPLGPLPVLLRDLQFTPGHFAFSFTSQSSLSYAAQFIPAPGPTNWQTFTNVAGTGGTLSLTDTVNSASQRFYRVITE